ncbi:MAG: hypothetical protein CHACPFDD_03402 [Phycisphaerae bacterium]|nr:hypothetical protein [Phycisphaerae bacterium]
MHGQGVIVLWVFGLLFVGVIGIAMLVLVAVLRAGGRIFRHVGLAMGETGGRGSAPSGAAGRPRFCTRRGCLHPNRGAARFCARCGQALGGGYDTELYG